MGVAIVDDIGVKKAAGEQVLHDCRVAEGEKPKSAGRENRTG